MLKWILQKIVGNKNQREIKRMNPIVAKINEIEEALQEESEATILSKVKAWQQHLHRYLPLQAPTKRAIEAMEPESLKNFAQELEDRLSLLRQEYPELPVVEATPESIEAAKNAFTVIEDDFASKRELYLKQILPEAYAVVKNGARRMFGRSITLGGNEIKWNMIHFDVQLVGGIALHNGMIAEMQTGEGKTLRNFTSFPQCPHRTRGACGYSQ